MRILAKWNWNWLNFFFMARKRILYLIRVISLQTETKFHWNLCTSINSYDVAETLYCSLPAISTSVKVNTMCWHDCSSTSAQHRNILMKLPCQSETLEALSVCAHCCLWYLAIQAKITSPKSSRHRAHPLQTPHEPDLDSLQIKTLVW